MRMRSSTVPAPGTHREEPKLPGTGGLIRRGLDRFIAECVNGLAEHAAQVAGARTDAA
jgi:hypothetical protein